MLRVSGRHFANFCNPPSATVKPFSYWIDLLEVLYGRQEVERLDDWLTQQYVTDQTESFCDYAWTLNQDQQVALFEKCVAFMEENRNG